MKLKKFKKVAEIVEFEDYNKAEAICSFFEEVKKELCDDLIILTDEEGTLVLLYDPKTETEYGYEEGLTILKEEYERLEKIDSNISLSDFEFCLRNRIHELLYKGEGIADV